MLVSEIGIDAWQLGGPLMLDGNAGRHPEIDSDSCVKLIQQCSDLGINFVDTAEQYGSGESERRIGKALKGRRERWIVSTKFGSQVGPHGERVRDASPKQVQVSLEGSLQRLQTDYLDVYVWDISPTPGEAEEVAKYLAAAKQKGQVRAVGIATANLADLEFLHSLGCLDVVQFPHSMIGPSNPIVDFVAKRDIGGVVCGAFADVRLTGDSLHKPPQFGAQDIQNTQPDVQGLTADFARYALFEEMLLPWRGIIQLALRWLLDEPTTDVIIIGGKSLEEYRQAVCATELPPLTQSERARIKQFENPETYREKPLSRLITDNF